MSKSNASSENFGTFSLIVTHRLNPKTTLKKHPNYRDFYVDPLRPLELKPPPKPSQNWKELLAEFQQTHGCPLKPVKHRGPEQTVSEGAHCPNCHAPAEFLYFNDGNLRKQIRCKVCSHLFQLAKPLRKPKTKFWCPYCWHALYRWKRHKDCTLYKRDYDECPAYLKALQKLNTDEKELRKTHSSQFKLRYQYREYHFTTDALMHAAPDSSKVDIDKIHNTPSVLGLVLTFHISFAIAARKTAQILTQVFGIPISYQTVLNYAEAAAPYCHHFNLTHKGEIDNESAGDETYIKIQGKHAFTFLFISAKNLKITAYHVADSRDTLPATVARTEASRTAKPNQKLTFITDGNPAYPAGLHVITAQRDPDHQIQHHKVIGLQNLDTTSELYRHFKQISERLNRTCKYHIRAAGGFKSYNGAISWTTLVVTYYNFLRPHMSPGYQVPIPVKELKCLYTIQEKWCKIIDMAKLSAPWEQQTASPLP